MPQQGELWILAGERSAWIPGCIIGDDPAEFVETIREKQTDKKRRRPFSVEQIRAVLAVADAEWRSMIHGTHITR